MDLAENDTDHHEENESNKKSINDHGCPSINRTLLPSKIFYFFYFSSWGSLMPYMALYFKEMMLSPSQVGILMGLRPVVNFVFNPLWGLLIDKFSKGKLVLLIALVACISTTFSLSLISPAEEICKEKHNNFNSVTKRATVNFSFILIIQPSNLTSDWINHSFKFYMSSVSTQPWPLVFLDLETTTPRGHGASKLFFHLFFILLFGNVVAAPALTIVDTYTVKKLGDRSHQYGSQRLWGSLGFGLAAFIVGACVSVTHYCPNPFTKPSEINYSLCFYSFAILMSLALVVATRFDLNGSAQENEERTKSKDNHCTTSPISNPEGTMELPSRIKSATTFKGQIHSLKELVDLKFLLFLYSAFFFGFLAAFIKTFLFWHLKDIGGTPELFCIIVAIHCVAEVTMYFLSSRLIRLLGHLKVLYLGFVCYFIRCFTYWLLSKPWSVLPIEVLSGVTSAAVWSAMLSYVGQKSCDNNATTMQGLLHGIHWGLGNGSGEMIGGVIVSGIGTSNSFLILGFASLVYLTGYLAFNNARDIIQTIKARARKYT